MKMLPERRWAIPKGRAGRDLKRSSRAPLLAFLLGLGFGCGGGLSAQDGFAVQAGALGECQIAIAVPTAEPQGLILVAHGFRPVDAPRTAEVNLADPFTRSRLEQGWVVAATSYRRNGWIVEDAILDLSELKAEVERRLGPIPKTVLIGSSMGGFIGLRVAESTSGLANAVLALGAALPEGEEEIKAAFRAQPCLPVLFLSNQGEASGPQAYAALASPKRAVVWTVDRPGHVNLSLPEREAAFSTLLSWMEGAEPPAPKDATQEADPGPSSARFLEGAALGSVTDVSPAHGNIETTFIAHDLRRLGLQPGQNVRIEGDRTSLSARWGSTYSDVPRGAGVVFLNSAGFLRIARNFASAAEVLTVKPGDTLTLRPESQPPEPPDRPSNPASSLPSDPDFDKKD